MLCSYGPPLFGHNTSTSTSPPGRYFVKFAPRCLAPGELSEPTAGVAVECNLYTFATTNLERVMKESGVADKKIRIEAEHRQGVCLADVHRLLVAFTRFAGSAPRHGLNDATWGGGRFIAFRFRCVPPSALRPIMRIASCVGRKELSVASARCVRPLRPQDCVQENTWEPGFSHISAQWALRETDMDLHFGISWVHREPEGNTTPPPRYVMGPWPIFTSEPVWFTYNGLGSKKNAIHLSEPLLLRRCSYHAAFFHLSSPAPPAAPHSCAFLSQRRLRRRSPTFASSGAHGTALFPDYTDPACVAGELG
eukprot:gene10381-biopygen21310